MDALFHFLEVVVLSVAGLIALALVLPAVVSQLPGSPLQAVLAAFAKRLGATAAVALLAIPIEPIPGVDAVYDVAAVIFLLVYWFGIFKEIGAALRTAPRPGSVRINPDPRDAYDVPDALLRESPPRQLQR